MALFLSASTLPMRAFLVGLECEDISLLERIHSALRDPVWPLALGRKSYVPSESIWMEDGLQDAPLREVLARWPWIATQRKWEERPEKLLVSFESEDGSGVLKMDQPLSSFAERRFGARFVRSEWIPFPQEVSQCSCIEFILIYDAERLDVTWPIPTSFIPHCAGHSARRRQKVP